MRSILASTIIVVSVGLFSTGLAHESSSLAREGTLDAAPQASAKTTADPVYSDEQSTRGQALSDKLCSSCHGDKLAGDVGPPLQGPDFLSGWKSKPVADLSEKIQTTMPQDAAGSLNPQQVVDLMAYLFKLNGFPAGSSELAPGAGLAQITIASK
ncbi:MAG TPA: cytochrome c [Vicinamibacterales bacterium]|jgi:mono/diheme cytochrome c family protein|nr:cytochrome c [Vicinamibacterales bacterium]